MRRSGRATPDAAPLDPQMVLGAYAIGVFPMADARDARSIHWVEPKDRAILPLDRFHLSKSLRKTLSADRFRITADQAFADIIQLCAEAAEDRPDTWINGQIEEVYLQLHAQGFAHSIEVWEGERLAGGLYGLALGRAFFGESMVSRARDASKVAIAALVARLRVGGFSLLDCQFMTDHLASLGAIEIPRRAYLGLLSGAISGVVGAGATGATDAAGDFFALDRGAAVPFALPAPPLTVFGPPSGKVIAQLLVHTS
ncbi:leucyl/phenylalanyl-tRNA--protein transferase [Sphingomonas qilianensis]|uniref:Leucyl/phenylalanyl-tRNA--protein transferase n=1 Tax=Sphingomonas qilianensis TaxID=1736690 RepID=A0ABU9XSQ7_9SPHN